MKVKKMAIVYRCGCIHIHFCSVLVMSVLIEIYAQTSGQNMIHIFDTNCIKSECYWNVKVLFNYDSVLCRDELWIVTDAVCAVKTLAGDLLRALANFEMWNLQLKTKISFTFLIDEEWSQHYLILCWKLKQWETIHRENNSSHHLMDVKQI